MKKALLTIIAMFIGFVTMMFSLLLAIPLTIAAFFTGKRIKKQLDQELSQHQQAMNGNTIEGEYEEVSSR